MLKKMHYDTYKSYQHFIKGYRQTTKKVKNSPQIAPNHNSKGHKQETQICQHSNK